MSTHEDPTTEPTIGRLVSDATKDLSALVQHEIALAKTELRVSLKAGVLGSALFGLAGFLGLLMIVMLSFAYAYGLVLAGLDEFWSFLIVAGTYLLLAIVCVLVGVGRMKKIRAPQHTIESVGKIPAALKGRPTPPGA